MSTKLETETSAAKKIQSIQRRCITNRPRIRTWKWYRQWRFSETCLYQSDDDQFLSCYECGNTFGIHETHFDSNIRDSVQTISNPFDNDSTFLSTDNRATQRKKNKCISRSKRSRQTEKIDADLTSGKGVVNILYDSSTQDQLTNVYILCWCIIITC